MIIIASSILLICLITFILSLIHHISPVQNIVVPNENASKCANISLSSGWFQETSKSNITSNYTPSISINLTHSFTKKTTEDNKYCSTKTCLERGNSIN